VPDLHILGTKFKENLVLSLSTFKGIRDDLRSFPRGALPLTYKSHSALGKPWWGSRFLQLNTSKTLQAVAVGFWHPFSSKRLFKRGL